MRTNWATSQFDQRHLPRPAPVGVGVEMELVHHHLVYRCASRRSEGPGWPGSSAVQQITGASGLIDASPVNMPTFSVPSWAQRSKNFSETRALMGALYQDRPTGGQHGQVGAECHQALARARRRGHYDVVTGQNGQDCLFLGRVEMQAAQPSPAIETLRERSRGSSRRRPGDRPSWSLEFPTAHKARLAKAASHLGQ